MHISWLCTSVVHQVVLPHVYARLRPRGAQTHARCRPRVSGKSRGGARTWSQGANARCRQRVCGKSRARAQAREMCAILTIVMDARTQKRRMKLKLTSMSLSRYSREAGSGPSGSAGIHWVVAMHEGKVHGVAETSAGTGEEDLQWKGQEYAHACKSHVRKYKLKHANHNVRIFQTNSRPIRLHRRREGAGK